MKVEVPLILSGAELLRSLKDCTYMNDTEIHGQIYLKKKKALFHLHKNGEYLCRNSGAIVAWESSK